jgi:hypothetical protein
VRAGDERRVAKVEIARRAPAPEPPGSAGAEARTAAGG